ncbi:MAG: nitroreductase family protein [Clostridia bacterium]|nr:nitroreductase family protein [Clostridia bacterium]
MNNPTMDVLMNRKSVRVFTEQEIAPEIKEAILGAAMRAPTAGNMMLYTIIDVTDQEIKDKLAVNCDHQPFIATSKMCLVFCADYHRWIRKFKQAECENIPELELSDLILATNDAVIAAHAACVAAESFGIGSCYIGDIIENFEKNKEMLNLPDHVAPVSMLVFGYPTEQQKERAQVSRYPKEWIVHENSYRELTEDELMQYRPNDTTKALYNRKYVSEFAREMVRSTKVIFENWNKN